MNWWIDSVTRNYNFDNVTRNYNFDNVTRNYNFDNVTRNYNFDSVTRNYNFDVMIAITHPLYQLYDLEFHNYVFKNPTVRSIWTTHRLRCCKWGVKMIRGADR